MCGMGYVSLIHNPLRNLAIDNPRKILESSFLVTNRLDDQGLVFTMPCCNKSSICLLNTTCCGARFSEVAV